MQPWGTGPMRWSAIEPDAPLLEPPVKLNSSVAPEQLRNTSVPVPTATLCGVVAVEPNVPPVVSYRVKGIARMPRENAPWPVYQRCPAAAAPAPPGAYVYHARNSVDDPGLTSTVNP